MAILGCCTIVMAPQEASGETVAVPESTVLLAFGGAVAAQITSGGRPQRDSNMGREAFGTIWEGQDVWVLARVMLPNGAPLTQDDVTDTDVKYELINITGGVIDTESETVGKTTAIKNDLTNDGYWDADSDGYNLVVRVPWSDWTTDPTPGGLYAVEIEIPTTSYGDIIVVGKLRCQGLVSDPTS